MELNSCQTPIEELGLDTLPKEVQDQFWDFFNNVPYIQILTSKDRPRAKDLPRDDEGKIIIDISHPHILEDMDYFRPTAIHYQKTGRFTDLRPNGNPNSEYAKWIEEEVKRCWYGYVRESDGEWITGDYYFFLNYCEILMSKTDDKKQSVEDIENGEIKKKRVVRGKKRRANRAPDFPLVHEGQYLFFHYLELARNSGNHAGELAARGKGKAHPYNETVYTPDGIKNWGDIKVGDYLFGDNGEITKVIDIPFDDIAPIYKITFANGESVECSEGHLWKVKSHNRGNIVIDTKELLSIYKRNRKISDRNPKGVEYDCTILKNEGVEYPYKETLVDPYTFGLLLGDGCFRVKNSANKTYFTAADEDFETYKQFIPYNWFKYNNTKFGYNLRIQDFGNILKTYGLYMAKSENKFIPDEYKYNSREVRLELLRGILDADGTVSSKSRHGDINISLASKRLIEDIREICASLGIQYGKLRIKHTWYKNKEGVKVPCLDSYRTTVFSDIPLFHLERKLKLWRDRSFSNYGRSHYTGTKIVNIEFVGNKQAKCVTVDNSSHCYLIGKYITTHNSYSGASMLAKRFVLGESQEVCEQVQCVVTAYERKYIQGANQILDMFKKYIDFLVLNTEFPSKRLTDSIQTLTWRMGYKDLDTGAERGTLNSVMGITSHDDESKLRGSRGVLYIIEEFGSFPRLLGTYNTMRPSVEDGDDVFGTIAMWGTAGDEDSDFASAQEIMYNPKGYNMYPIINVYDKHGQGRKFFVYFYPGYINRAKCYDINGNSDVTKALVEILMDRYTVKYNSTDANAITKRISEIPITPQEAILRSKGKMFPTTELTQRLNDIDNDPTFYDNVATGTLIINSNGEVEYKLTDDKPIRNFPHKDNKLEGAIEFYKMPEKDSNGRVFEGRYILGHDPVDSDEAETLSLTSTFVLDLFTDQIVCEWTGRYDVADKNFEMVRRICLFYNAKCMYEQNKKGMYSYFQRMGCLSYLADTPEYLRDRDVIKHIGTGNGAKGVNATAGVNDFADRRIRDWMLKVVPIPNPRYTGESDSEEPETIDNFNLYNIPSRALLLEAIAYCKEGNYDRIRALGMLMIYREQYLILYGDDIQGGYEEDDGDSLADDDFFDRNS